MDTLLQDLKYGVRLLFKNLGISIIAVLALGLGIGANTAIFSVVNTMLLRPLPYKNAERLVFLNEKTDRLANMSVSYLNFVDWREQNQSFDYLAATRFQAYNLTGKDEPERIVGAEVSADLFPALGVQPFMGRAFSAEDDKPGANRVMVMGYGLWERRFGADPDILGQALTLNGDSFTVIGIMPQDFRPFPQFGAQKAEIWSPIGLQADAWTQRGNHPGIYCVALLKEGVSVQQAQTDLSTIAKRLEEQYPQSNTGNGVDVIALHERVVGDVRTPLLILLSAVGFVLLIACANVANLLLARAAVRAKEIAVRVALGAGRIRLIRQLLTESVVLALTGGIIGVLLAYWGINLLVAASSTSIPRMAEVTIDNTVLGFTLLLSLVTGFIFGLAPALQTSKPDLNDHLKDSVRGSTGDIRRNRLRSTLVVAEVALSLVLLIGAGLLIKSFWHVQGLSPGYNPDNVLTMSVALPQTTYPDGDAQRNFFNQLLPRLKALPGVESAGITIPLLGGWQTSFFIDGRPQPNPGEFPLADYGRSSPDYFKTMGIPLLKGRYFTEFDHQDAPQVIIIDELFAKTHFPDEEPLGKRLGLGGPDNTVWGEIIGVVGHVKNYGVAEESRIEMYFPYLQIPVPPMNLVLKTTGDPLSMAGAVRSQVLGVDPNLPVYNIQTMEQILDDSVAPRRLTMLLLTIFASVALVLAAVGIYGVMSYTVSQRTHEIGIRMALGAQQSSVVGLVVGQGMTLVGIGLLIGFIVAVIVMRFLTSVLFGVEPTDITTFGVIPVILAVVALVASYIPARRAARVDPLVALRYE